MKRTREWTDADKERAAEIATGYVMGLSMCQQEFGVDQDEIDDVLLDMQVERCPGCHWYVDSFDLIPKDGDDEPDGKCSNCR